MGSWGRSSGPSGAIFGARPPARCWVQGRLGRESCRDSRCGLAAGMAHWLRKAEEAPTLPDRRQHSEARPSTALPQLVRATSDNERRHAPSFTTAILIPERSPRCRRKRSCRSPRLCRSLLCTIPRSETLRPDPPLSICRQLTKPIHPGPCQPPVSDSLSLRCRGRYTRPRVLRRLPLLHRLHPADGRPLLRHPRRPGLPVRREACLRHESLFPRAAGAMD